MPWLFIQCKECVHPTYVNKFHNILLLLLITDLQKALEICSKVIHNYVYSFQLLRYYAKKKSTEP